MPRVLTQSQLDAYRRDGFASPFDAITPEQAAECVAKIEAYEAEIGDDVSKHIRVRAVMALKWVWDLANAPAIKGALQDVMGEDVAIYLSAIWSKPGRSGKFVSWHQDGTYYPVDRHEGATAWLALTDSTPDRGCIRAIRGSHAEAVHDHDETYDENNLLSRGQSIPRGSVDETRACDMPLRAGQFSIHHELTVHGSNPNRSDERRIGISFACVPASALPTDGMKSIVLLAGENRPGHWALDPVPRYDLDPVCMAALEKVAYDYRNPQVVNEARRARVAG